VAFIDTVPVTKASGEVRAIYEENQQSWGYVPNYVKLFSNRPNVLQTWGAMVGTIRGNMDPRCFEMVTLAAAHALRNSYCMLAHTPRLEGLSQPGDNPGAIATDFHTAVLSEVDRAIMTYAEKIALDATLVTQDDVDGLRRHGLSDQDIFDIAATAAARSFFTKLLDGLGAQPDSAFNEIDESLRRRLEVGRPISSEQVETLGA
jgi:uncharacterized peroxidase-related enzyme